MRKLHKHKMGSNVISHTEADTYSNIPITEARQHINTLSDVEETKQTHCSLKRKRDEEEGDGERVHGKRKEEREGEGEGEGEGEEEGGGGEEVKNVVFEEHSPFLFVFQHFSLSLSLSLHSLTR